jgi:hypothetical protein
MRKQPHNLHSRKNWSPVHTIFLLVLPVALIKIVQRYAIRGDEHISVASLGQVENFLHDILERVGGTDALFLATGLATLTRQDSQDNTLTTTLTYSI